MCFFFSADKTCVDQRKLEMCTFISRRCDVSDFRSVCGWEQDLVEKERMFVKIGD